MNIQEALMSMDALDDDQWTGDGAPKVSAVEEVLGEKTTRQAIIEVAPEFSRENMVIASNEPEEALPEGGDQESDTDEEVLTVSTEIIEEYLSDDPMTEAQFIPLLMRVEPEQLGMMEQVLIEQLTEAEAAIVRATDLKNRVKRSLFFTRSRIKSEVPDVSNQEAIQAFIKSQTETRSAKIKYTREVLAGVDLKSLDPRAAIDRAMARKAGRGGSRPVRPMMTK